MHFLKNPISATVCELLSGRLSCCEGENKRKLAPAYQMLLFRARVSTADLDVHEFPLGKKKGGNGKKKKHRVCEVFETQMPQTVKPIEFDKNSPETKFRKRQFL